MHPIPSLIEVKDTGTPRGRGVFATVAYQAGDLVETAPVLLVEAVLVAASAQLRTYVYKWPRAEGEPPRLALALGYGSLYNSADPCNLDTQSDSEAGVIRFYALRRIEPGEELTHDYGAGWWERHGIKRWFSAEEQADGIWRARQSYLDQGKQLESLSDTVQRELDAVLDGLRLPAQRERQSACASNDPVLVPAPREAVPATTLRRMTKAEYGPWLASVIPAYAADKVVSGQWTSEQALELACNEYAEVLPAGLETEGAHLFSIVNEGTPVGALGFQESARFGRPMAFVFNVQVVPEHRRKGYARQAFAALEREAALLGLQGIGLHVFGHNAVARALYESLGFEPSNIVMFKGPRLLDDGLPERR